MCDASLRREIAVDLHPRDEVTVGKVADFEIDSPTDIPAVVFALIGVTRGHRSETFRVLPQPAAALRPLLHRPILTT
jgi:hypothetical protein